MTDGRSGRCPPYSHWPVGREHRQNGSASLGEAKHPIDRGTSQKSALGARALADLRDVIGFIYC